MRILTIFLIFSVNEIKRKIKGAIINHTKFKGVRKLMILRFFIILYVQILSGFEIYDIQNLTLRGYDTIKTCR